MKNNQTGRSMIEMLGVLAIIAVLSVGGIAGYSKALTKFKINKIVNQVTTIAANIKTLYAQQKDFEGLTTESATLMGAIPNEMGSSYPLTNPFNGAFNIYTSYYTDGFALVYDDLPKDVCLTLVTMGWEGKNSSGLAAISASPGYNSVIGGVSNVGCSGGVTTGAPIPTYTACSGGDVIQIPMPPEYAIQACNCKDNDCRVSWSYY